MNIFNKQEITTGDRIVAYIDGKCFIRDGRGKPETLVVENFRLDDLIEYIKKNVKSVNICGIDDLSFLSECQSIERLTLTLIVELDRYDTLIKKRESEFYIWYDKVYDYQQIYDLLNLKKLAIDDAGARDQYMQINSKLKIDLCRFPYLRVYYGKYKFTKSLDTKVNMQTLGLSDYGRENIIEFSRMAELDTLSLTHSKIKNLKGCEFFPKLQCVYLGFNRTLTDISDLKYAKNTLRMLEIDHCGHIEDFSVLNELENLEFLRLLGTNTITDIQFIKKLPKLKTFICDYKVKDGDVHPCGLINGYVYIQNRKNFNTKEYGDDNYPRTIPSKEEGIYLIDNYLKMINEEEYDKDVLKELLVFDDTSKQPSRIKCATLSANGIKDYLEEENHS